MCWSAFFDGPLYSSHIIHITYDLHDSSPSSNGDADNHLNWLQVSSSSDGDADSGVDETTQGLWNCVFLDVWQRLWQHRNYDDCDDYDVMLIKKVLAVNE